ncbi:hypothetical protein M409DRAFT_25903 [Zasmidium cellare ATCC 36951]|uniref:Cyanovirin-N domain-containing protein n=1 Tax=Zasmidium cellare ATCC 36951 TaxID=1080233 RepID=A0A6A6C959_ZASCE|nr:uncharacterized protein M409DRAFT_25903 [Zasmidium cellare ATCC 36951]KAF2163717.1 hypothetical protein M409DRAFT_25903 [Zasmidium cellare ATCC 36951]
MRSTKPFLLFTTLLPLASADFFVSNTSVCMGSFGIAQCYTGAKVLSGTNNKTDYTCSHLVPAQDDHYLSNGTAGPFGSDHLIVNGGLCDSGKLKFVKDGEAYIVNDEDDKTVGNCVWDNSTTRSCNMWVGMLFFQSLYKCTSSVCG